MQACGTLCINKKESIVKMLHLLYSLSTAWVTLHTDSQLKAIPGREACFHHWCSNHLSTITISHVLVLSSTTATKVSIVIISAIISTV